MNFMNTDATFYLNRSLYKCYQISEKEKKCKFLVACLNQKHHFLPFVDSVDGLLGVEAEVTLKQVSPFL